jgi:hypothetical protein
VNTTHKNLTPRKGIILAGGSGSRLKSLGWQAKVSLQDDLALAYQDFLNQVARVSAA